MTGWKTRGEGRQLRSPRSPRFAGERVPGLPVSHTPPAPSHMLLFIAQSPFPEIGPAELLFFKFLALIMMVLWPVYLVKEIFFSHKTDTRVDVLVTSVGALTTAIATTSAKMEGMERRQGELIQQQRVDAKELAEGVGALREGVDTILREHEAEIRALRALHTK